LVNTKYISGNYQFEQKIISQDESLEKFYQIWRKNEKESDAFKNPSH
jgi:hypothetical protein